MTLRELSIDYRAHAASLRGRIYELEAGRPACRDEAERLLLESRIRSLRSMWREARDLAVLTEHYYERGYLRNAKYTV